MTYHILGMPFLHQVLIGAFVLMPTTTVAAWINPQPVSKLLEAHQSAIAALKHACKETVGVDAFAQLPYNNDVFYLRYALDTPNDASAMMDKMHTNLQWRMGAGKSICDKAAAAVQAATADGNQWNNDPVFASAPHSATIGKYMTPASVMTTTSNQNDLIYCIRAGSIDDAALMKAVSIDQMVEFFLYAKEVNAMVANLRSNEQGLVGVVTANDLSGVKVIGGSADFRKALSESSKKANDLYPCTSGPTLLLNLPALASALVKLFTPLLPAAVRARIKFEQGPLQDVQNLAQIAKPGDARTTFLNQVDELIYA